MSSDQKSTQVTQEDVVVNAWPSWEVVPPEAIDSELRDARMRRREQRGLRRDDGRAQQDTTMPLDVASRDIEAALTRLSTDDFDAIVTEEEFDLAIESTTLGVTLSAMEVAGLDLHRQKHHPSATLTEFAYGILSGLALGKPTEPSAPKTRRQRLIARSVSLLDEVSNKTTTAQIWLLARSGEDETRMG